MPALDYLIKDVIVMVKWLGAEKELYEFYVIFENIIFY